MLTVDDKNEILNAIKEGIERNAASRSEFDALRGRVQNLEDGAGIKSASGWKSYLATGGKILAVVLPAVVINQVLTNRAIKKATANPSGTETTVTMPQGGRAQVREVRAN